MNVFQGVHVAKAESGLCKPMIITFKVCNIYVLTCLTLNVNLV